VAQGRGFLPEDHEPDSDPVVVISHRFWQEALGGRRDVFDTTLVLTPQTFILMLSPGAEDPEPVEFRIVGIMAPEFTGTRSQPGREIAFWIPFESIAPALVAGGDQEQPGSASAMFRSLRMQTVGKRKRAATDAAVASELNARFLADPESVVPLP